MKEEIVFDCPFCGAEISKDRLKLYDEGDLGPDFGSTDRSVPCPECGCEIYYDKVTLQIILDKD